MDTLGWVKVDGIYIAHGGERYITIGNFSNDANTNSTPWPGLTHADIGYVPYYLDDVSVEEVTATTLPAFAGRDTAITVGDSVFIGSLTNGLTTEWTDGNGNAIASDVPGLWVRPTVATDYILKQTVCGFVSYDTVHVDVWPLGIEHSALPQVLVYPNPCAGAFNVSLPDGGGWQLGVYEMDGSRVDATQLSAMGEPRMRSRVEAAAGLYFVHISNTVTGAACVRKLVVQ